MSRRQTRAPRAQIGGADPGWTARLSTDRGSAHDLEGEFVMEASPTRPLRLRRDTDRVERGLERLLAAGMVLAGASQFRVAGLPVGPGEACLFIWVGLRALRGATLPSRLNRAGAAMLTFWAIFAVAQCLGLLRTLSSGVPVDWSVTMHDAVAYALMAAISSFCLCGRAVSQSLARITHDVMLFAAVSLGLQIAAGWGLAPAPGTGPWYWDRFRGWADNPNQLSLFCSVIIAIAIYVLETATTRRQRVVALTCAATAVAAGLLTKGNTLRLSLVIGALVFVPLAFRTLAFAHRERGRLPALVALLSIGAVPFMVVSALPYVAQLSTRDLAQQISRDQGETLNEADLRFTLWSGALKNGLESGYLGLGPGPHAPVPADVTLRRVWEADAFEEALGSIAKHADFMESHNTYIELFSQGGLLIILCYGWLLVRAGRNAMASRTAALPALFAVLLVFGVFHVMVRHPVVWFALCLCVAGSGRQASFGVARGIAGRGIGRVAFGLDRFGPDLASPGATTAAISGHG